MSLLMWVWVLPLYPIHPWQLMPVQHLPLAHQPLEQESSPLKHHLPTPLILHSWGCGGELFPTSWDWSRNTQLHFFLTTEVDTSGERIHFGGALNLCLPYARKMACPQSYYEVKKEEQRKKSLLLVCFLKSHQGKINNFLKSKSKL